ncbi:MAG TPA: 4Fe-4S binding protein [Candidatus Binatia bacterium]|nr:4Fe-4S binding protein [Candidatus Binatia bacterium]
MDPKPTNNVPLGKSPNRDLSDPMRFTPKVAETSKIRVTRFTNLCKSCGECIMKCPVNAISWHDKELGMLGDPAIYIDLDKCIGCETCERVCPDHAIEITNKRLESKLFSTGVLGWIVRLNAKTIEWVVTRVHTSKDRLKKVGKTKDKTVVARLMRGFLMYWDEPVKEYDVKE